MVLNTTTDERPAFHLNVPKQAFENQALDVIGEATGLAGDDLQDFVSDMYEQRPEEMARAIRQHLSERSTAGYQNLAAAYVDSLENDGVPEAGPGISVREHRGQVIVGVAGSEYRLADAVRLGLVKVSSRD